MYYGSLKSGPETDRLLRERIIDRPKPAGSKRQRRAELGDEYSSKPPANQEMLAVLIADLGFEFQQTTKTSGPPFNSVFRHDGKAFEGTHEESQEMANCVAALHAMDYLDGQ